jgi:hypothetical protein
MGLCQPVNIGIGKPLKTQVHQLWDEWIIDDEEVNNAASRPHSRLLLSRWITDSASQIKQLPTIVRNSWQYAEYAPLLRMSCHHQPPPPPWDVPEEERAVAQEAPAPTELPTRHQEAPPPPIHQRPEAQHQPELCRDPGWDDTDNSNYEPPELSSDDD